MISTHNEDSPGVQLTASEEHWLVEMATRRSKALSKQVDDPPTRAMNGLIKKGLATECVNGVWKLTELGQVRCTTIY